MRYLWFITIGLPYIAGWIVVIWDIVNTLIDRYNCYYAKRDFIDFAIDIFICLSDFTIIWIVTHILILSISSFIMWLFTGVLA